MPECRSLKIGYHSGPGQLVDIGDRRLGVAGAVARPARQQRRDQIGDRTADRLVDVDLRGRVFLLLEVAHADDETRDAVGLVQGQDAVGELDGLVDVAVGQRGDEGAVEQLVVLGIGAQRRAIERRSRSGVALDAGVARGQIAAGRGQRLQIALGRKLRRAVGRMSGRLRQRRARHRERAEVSAAIVQRLKRLESITDRLAPGFQGRRLLINLECEPDRRHQGLRQCRFWH